MPVASATDLLSPRAVHDPYGLYADLRATGPVVWSPEHHGWILTTHAEVAAAFRDQRLSSDRLTPLEARLDEPRRAVLGPTFELLRGWMVFHDPPHHERLRDPVRRAFTPKAVEALRPHVESLVDGLLDDLAAEGGGDWVASAAFPLPAIVIAELLGVPPADRDRFKTWSQQLSAIVFGAGGRPAAAELAAAGSAQFADYFAWLIRQRSDAPGDDLTSVLIAARRRPEGGADLSASELVGALTLLLFGGHETTTNLLGNAVLALATHDGSLAWLRQHPEAIGGAVEELHRYDGPTKFMVRIVAEAHDRGGQHLEPGQTVFLGTGSANRDPDAFRAPDDLVLDRPDAQRHVGFGTGIHYCLGAPLARLEAQVTLGRLARRFEHVRLAVDPDELTYAAVILGRGLTALPIEVG